MNDSFSQSEYEDRTMTGIRNSSRSSSKKSREFNDITMKGVPYGGTAKGEHPQLLLERYRIIKELGRGGMGVVYHCQDEISKIEVAVKTLPPELSGNSSEMEDILDNFQLVQGLNHPNIAAVKQLEQDSSTGEYVLVMEYVNGTDLKHWMREKRRSGKEITLDMVIPILRQVALALDFAHEKKVIHRDIKPSNIMITAEGEVKVLDFGLAAQCYSSLSHVSMAYKGTSGTGPYMAPEQWEGRPQGATADQYALAVTAYEILSGHLPFDASDSFVLHEAVLHSAPERIEKLSSFAWAALNRGLSKTSGERFACCGDFVDALAGKKIPDAKTVHKSLNWLWILLGIFVLAGGGGIWFAHQRNLRKLEQADKAAKIQAVQENAALENAALETVAQKKVVQENAALENADLDKAALDKAALEKAALEKAALEKAALENAAQETVAQETAAQETVAQETVAQENAALEKAALEKAALEKAALEKAALEKAALEKAALEKAALEKAALEKAALEKENIEKERQLKNIKDELIKTIPMLRKRIDDLKRETLDQGQNFGEHITGALDCFNSGEEAWNIKELEIAHDYYIKSKEHLDWIKQNEPLRIRYRQALQKAQKNAQLALSVNGDKLETGSYEEGMRFLKSAEEKFELASFDEAESMVKQADKCLEAAFVEVKRQVLSQGEKALQEKRWEDACNVVDEFLMLAPEDPDVKHLKLLAEEHLLPYVKMNVLLNDETVDAKVNVFPPVISYNVQGMELKKGVEYVFYASYQNNGITCTAYKKVLVDWGGLRIMTMRLDGTAIP